MFEPLTEWVCLFPPHVSSARRKKPGALGAYVEESCPPAMSCHRGKRYKAFMDDFVIAAHPTWTSDFNTIS